MSALARHDDQAARRPNDRPAERVRADGRLRRANAGTLTEMTRSLLDDAREVRVAERRRRAHVRDTLT
ncbi:MAG TPA: hypothetical protein VK655_10100 [Solirubrobacteraceae bacterium]|jgi:hypothetical protein|nr:hypothetical protein [Solirubrobacteraceae bacterium]